MPKPLPPPPGLLEMKHDSVFNPNFDVPKIGTNIDYKPPELIYNELYNEIDPNQNNPYSYKKYNSPPSYKNTPMPKKYKPATVSPKQLSPMKYNSPKKIELPSPPKIKRYSPTPPPFRPTPAELKVRNEFQIQQQKIESP